MKLWLRMIWAFNGWRFKSPLTIADVSKRTFRVWPTDIDAFNHMNNGVYLTLMDLGRFDLMLRAGKWQVFKKLGWYPVVVSVSIVFRKSLAPWTLFDIESKIIGWDHEAVFVEQRFTRDGEIYTRAFVKLRWLKKPRGIVTPQEVIDQAGGWPGEVPVLPAWINDWNEATVLPKGKEPAPSNWD
ncbi:MAG: acyl-CoA thioesterase [Micrococcales bacterium]